MWTNRTLCLFLSGEGDTGVSDSDIFYIVLRLVEGPIGWELTRRIAALHPATASSLLHRRDTLFQQIRPIFTLGTACTRRCHRTRGPPRTSAPTTAPHGNPADTAHGRVALVATEAARVHCAPLLHERGGRASCTGGRTCTDASRRGSGLNDYPNIDTCILIQEVLYSSASSRGRGAVTNKEGQADGQRRADREAGGGRGRRGT